MLAGLIAYNRFCFTIDVLELLFIAMLLTIPCRGPEHHLLAGKYILKYVLLRWETMNYPVPWPV